MLKNCPECELMVSDKANICPHCGFQLIDPIQKIKTKNKSTRKHRRLPNGFGQITEMKNHNLRKPFRVMITTGKTEDGRPIVKSLQPIAYFSTYNEAYEALVEYNRHPYDLKESITMNELYNKWLSNYSKNIKTESSMRSIESAWAYCKPIYEYQVVTIRPKIIRNLMDTASRDINGETRPASARTKVNIKTLLNRMFNFAVEYELIEENFISNFEIDKDTKLELTETKNEHMAFTQSELEKLISNSSLDNIVRMIVIQTYTGLRPQELLNIKIEDINLKDMAIIGGLKTPAGKNRIVPIHTKISPLLFDQIKMSKQLGSDYLCPSTINPKNKMSYKAYSYGFKRICKELGLDQEHRPHDPRKTFITRAKEAGVDEYAIKRIVGHKISDITEAVYTERSIDWLHEEIKKIK